MSNRQEMKILNLCKGKTIGQALYRLSIAEGYHQTKVLTLRLKLANLSIRGEYNDRR